MGLRQHDLKKTVYHIISIDEYSSKMGDDENVCTLSFSVKGKSPAQDLSDFIEKGYTSVLDSDVSPGENIEGNYQVFVELPRDRSLHSTIIQILTDVGKLSDVSDFKFRYYKQFRSLAATEDNLKEFVPDNPDNYGIVIKNTATDNYFEFFDKTLADEVHVVNETIVFRKKHADEIKFEIVDYGKPEDIDHTITESCDILNSYPETLYLTKYIGEYNILKYGENLVFENGPNILVLKRLT